MKKILCLILCLAFFLCGCQRKAGTPLIFGIKCDASIVYNNEKYVCHIITDTDGEIVYEVISPQTISSVKLTFEKDGNNKAEFHDIVYEPGTDEFLSKSVFKKCTDIMNDANKKQLEIKSKENPTVKGKIGNIKYKFTFSPAGLPLYIEANDGFFKINFSNITEI